MIIKLLEPIDYSHLEKMAQINHNTSHYEDVQDIMKDDCPKQTNTSDFYESGYHAAIKAAIDFDRKAYQNLFLLNGAAATALLATNNVSIKIAAILFAVGAFFAIIATMCAYFSSCAVATWWQVKGNLYPFNEPCAQASIITRMRYKYEKWCLEDEYNCDTPPVVFALFSAFSFLSGLISFGCKI